MEYNEIKALLDALSPIPELILGMISALLWGLLIKGFEKIMDWLE
jgi:hypothetical protein